MRSSITFAVLPAAITATLTATPASTAHADDPALGASTYLVYESFLSPAQEPGEESEIPKPLEKSLGATKPSTPRAQRASRGWGKVRFTRDLTSALVDVEIKTRLAGGKLSVKISNDDLTFASMLPKGFKPKLPESCPVEPGFPVQVKTLSGMEHLARKGVLYFNLHTKAHTYYGEMRGQLYPGK